MTPPDAAPDAPLAPAVLSIMPMSSDFGSVEVNTNSTATAFTVRNTGEAESGAINAVVSGAAGDFQVANGCTTLVGGGTCVISVTFRPTSPGTKTGMLLVTGSPGGSTMANLTGVGNTAGTLRLTPMGNQSFGDVLVGATGTAKVFTVTNTGGVTTGTITVQGAGDTLRFPKTADTCNGMTLAAGAMCSFTVNFAPNSSGPKAATYDVSANPGGTVTASVSGNGQDPAALTTNSTLVPFGTVNVGASSSPTTIVFTNSGDVNTSALTMPVIAPAGEFTITNENCTGIVLQANGANSCSVIVTFSPTAAGARPNRTLTVSATTGGSVAVTLTGSGSQPGALTSAPPSRAYGNVNVGATSDFTFTITNPGTTTVTGVTATTNAPQYTIVGPSTCQGATLAANGTCTVTVRFAPNGAGGQQDGTLTVSATGASGSAIVPLTGFGLSAASISISPPGQFGSAVIGTSVMRTFTVTNNGGTATPVPTVTLNSPDFSMNNGCTAAIAPNGGTCTIVVTFTPTAPAGTKNATLVVMAGTTVNHALTGDAITNAQIVTNPGSLTFDPTLLGDSSGTQTFTLTNNGSVTTGPITIVRTGNADFTQTNNCTTLAQGASCTVTVTFSPTATGNRSATFTVNTGAGPGGGASTVVNGTGEARLQIITPATNPYDFGTVMTGLTADGMGPNTVVVTIRNNTSSNQMLDMTALNSPFSQHSTGCGGFFLQCCTDGMTLLARGGNIFGIPADSCQYTVEFAPNDSQNGPQTGSQTFSIGTGMFDSVTQNFQGVGNTARLAISPDPTNFGSAANPVSLNTNSAPQTITIRNMSASATGALNVVVPYPFHVTGDMCSGMTLAAGGMCTLTVVYRPTGACPAGGIDNTLDITVTDQSGAVQGDAAALDGYCNSANTARNISAGGAGAFGDTFLNTTPSTTFTFQNDSSALSAPITAAVSGSPQFVRLPGAAGGTCGTSIPPTTAATGNPCTIIVQFNPSPTSQDMLVTGTLTVNGQALPLSGTPRATAIQQSGLTFLGSESVNGGVNVETWVARNISNDPTTVTAITSSSAEITIINNGCGGTLAPSPGTGVPAAGSTCMFQVRFAPTTTGAKMANISIVAQGGAHGTTVVPVTAAGLTAPQLVFDPVSYNFGSQPVTGGVDFRDFRLTNLGETASGTVTLSGLSGAFAVVGTATQCGSIAAGASCTVTVRFDPTGAGATNGTLTATAAVVTNDVPGDTETAAVSGTGVADTVGLSVEQQSAALAPNNPAPGSSSAYYNATVINPTTPQTIDFVVTNSTGSSIVLDNTITPGDFVRVTTGAFPASAPNCGTSLSGGLGGMFCTVRIAFNPTSTGTKTGTLTVNSSLNVIAGLYGSAFQNANLAGVMNIDFGSREIQVTSPPRSITLTNNGPATIDNLNFVLDVPNPGDFTLSGSCVGANVDLEPTESCTLTATVNPSASGARSSLVRITSANGLSSSLTLLASGTNHPQVSVALSSGTVTETRVVAGVDATPTVYTVSNVGGATTTTSALDIVLAGTAEELRQFVFTTTGLTNPCAVTTPGPGRTAATSVTPTTARTTLAAGASCQIGILFNPTELVTGASVDLVVTDANTFDPPVTITNALTGTSTEPVTTPSPVSMGTNTNRNIVFTNNSSVATSPLDTSVADTSEPPGTPRMLSVISDGCVGQSIAPGASCTIVVRVTPDMSIANPPTFMSGLVEIYGTITTSTPPFAAAITHPLDSAAAGAAVAVRANLTP
ncbi:MAG: choice-of-anchor D domain-containing protein [Deltaproteobacteria bacterium]|nr:choice-of-anchor D domain-containing protein [Deltaproteobacteria bacterium]